MKNDRFQILNLHSLKLFLSPILAGALVITSSFASAQNRSGRRDEVSPLPAPITIATDLSTVGDYVLAMGYTRGVTPTDNVNYKVAPGARMSSARSGELLVVPNIDYVDFETKAIHDFALGRGIFKDPSVPVSARGVIVSRYGLEDPRATALLKELKILGLHSSVLITDGPITIDGSKIKFPEGENFSNEIRPELLRSGQNGIAVAELLGTGYQIKSPVLPVIGDLVKPGDYYIAMSAAANPKMSMTPIMHQKEVIMYILKDPSKPLSLDNVKKIFTIHGTGNWTRDHINRLYLYMDPSASTSGPGYFALKHTLATLEAFTRSGASARIDSIQSPGETTYVAKDGSKLKIAYTDGDFELNQRMADTFLVLSGDEETIKRLSTGNNAEYQRLKDLSNTPIDEVILSEFVITNQKVFQALLNLWVTRAKNGKAFKIRGGADGKFISMLKFALQDLVGSNEARTTYGRVPSNMINDLWNSIEMVGYLKQHNDAKNIDPDGPPFDRILLHDKTLIVGDLIVATGSYNLSTNYHNLERQDIFDFTNSTTSHPALIVAIKNSVITALSKALLSKKEALEIRKAAYILAFGDLVGQADKDLNWEKILTHREKLNALFKETPENRKKIVAAFIKLLQQQRKIPTNLSAKAQVSDDKFADKMKVAVQFLNEYVAQGFDIPGVDYRIGANEIMKVFMAFADSAMSTKSALRGILYRPYVSYAGIEYRAYQIFKKLELQKYFEKYPSTSWDGRPNYPTFYFSDIVFTPNHITKAVTDSAAAQLLQGNVQEALNAILKIATDPAHFPQETISRLSDTQTIAKRLNGLRSMVKWQMAQPNDPNYKYPIGNQTDLQIATRLLEENLDLLLLKETQESAYLQMVKFALTMKGYHDPEMTPLAQEGLNKFLNPETNLLLFKKKAEVRVANQILYCKQALGK